MGPESFPQNLSLRDGAAVTLGPLKPGDMDALQTFYRGLPEEERMVLKDDVTTPEWAQRFKARLETGAPWTRLVLILASVAIFTGWAGWLLRPWPLKPRA